jgi:hypothetical protein
MPVRSSLCRVLLAFCNAAYARAQQPAAAGISEMKRLAPLVGEWKGTGWVEIGPAPRHEFAVRETARWAAGGTVLVLEGLGLERQPDGSERAVHQAFAVVSWNPHEGNYRIHAFRAGGGEVEDSPVVSEHGLVWGFDDPRAGRVRFTIDFAGDVWHERGEISADGTSWRPFLEMRLTRQK